MLTSRASYSWPVDERERFLIRYAGSFAPEPIARAEGAWVEIAASTSGDYGNLLVNIGGGRTNTQAAGDGLIDIGIGAGGAARSRDPARRRRRHYR